MATERVFPRISLNKLGEYITATPVRRQRIIYDQKHPKQFITARYVDAQETIAEYLEGGMSDGTFIPRAIDRLLSLAPRTEWEGQNNSLCAEALEHFLVLAEKLDFRAIKCTAANPETPASVTISNVEISIRPELLVAVISGKKRGECGAIKLAFSKTARLEEDVAEHIASLLYHYLEATQPKETVCREKCFFLDVFGEQITEAPKTYRKRMKEVVAACKEIEARWTTL